MHLLPPADWKRCRQPQESYIQARALVALSLLCWPILGLLADPIPTGKPANYPGWWFARDVIVQKSPTNTSPAWPTNYPNADDYAAINQGQLKNFATAAYAELQAQAPAYIWSTSYGTNLTTMVNGWNPATGDAYAVANLGQLKTVAAPFYNVLIQLGYTNNYPWTGVHADDYAAANIGQAKNLFSFDVGLDSMGDGVPDWWELKYLGSAGYAATNLVPAGNGLTLLQDYQQGNNPTNYYSQNGGVIAPVVAITGGNNQVESPNTFVPQALSITVKDASNNALTNAPVTFAVSAPSDGQTATCTGGTGAGSQVVLTDATGTAHVYYSGGSAFNTASSIQATAGASSVTFTETTCENDGDVAAPTGITVSPGAASGQMILNWTNHATNAAYIVVQQSSDNVNWVTIDQIAPTLTNYTVNEADPTKSYYFGVIAGKP